MAPKIRSSSEIYGYFQCMGTEIPIAGIAGDQQAALFGQGCFAAGEAKNTYGTGCFLLTHTGNSAIHSANGLLTTIAATEAGKPIEYALEGSVFIGGAVIRWLRDEMKLIHDAKDSEYFAKKVADTGGVYFVPAFAGLGTPYWDAHARGTIVGLSAGVGKNHIIRAALESIAYQSEDLLAAMNADIEGVAGDAGKIHTLRVDGGASANGLLMQMQSDFSGIEVLRSANPEATAAGAAYLAGLAVGFFQGREELKNKLGAGDVYLPAIDQAEREKRMQGWHRAIKACRVFSESEE